MAYITPELVKKFVALTDDFEEAIRKDERARLLARFRAEFPSTGNQTDMHGEPVATAPATRLRTPWDDLAPSLRELWQVLADRSHPVTIVTIARELSIPRTAAYQRITALRKAGWNVQRVLTGTQRSKYRVASGR